MSWVFDRTLNEDGHGLFFVYVHDGDHPKQDITFFRGIQTLVTTMTFADPFGDATAEISLPQCSGFDPPSGATWFLKENVNVDIVWVPATRTDTGGTRIIDPATNQLGMWLDQSNAVTVWEGFFSNVTPAYDGFTVTCQGCLYQLDRYYAKPLFPLRPMSMERSIDRYFDPRRRGLWTNRLVIDYDGKTRPSKGFQWTRIFTKAEYKELLDKDPSPLKRYVPMPEGELGLEPGVTKWSGYLTRSTGSWDKALTGYVRATLASMYVVPEKMPNPTGVTSGDQWTITKIAPRTPVMYVRRQKAPIDVVAWYGSPGVEVQLVRDGTQINNVIFGRGTGYDGSNWLVQNFPTNGPWTMWAPIGWDKEPDTDYGLSEGVDADGNPVGIYHYSDDGWSQPLRDANGNIKKPLQYLRDALYDGYDASWERESNYWVQEKSWNNIPSGIDQDDAVEIAKQYIDRDKNPGWSGSITIRADLLSPADDPVSKWMLRDGMVIHLKGWRGQFTEVRQGEGEDPNVFHISQVTMSPTEGSVTLTVDSKFRDLLSVDEALQHTRDTLAPVAMLQVGKYSSLVEDLAVSWNTNAGAGCCPKDSVKVPRSSVFPYTGDTTKSPYRPRDCFVKARAYDKDLPDAKYVVKEYQNNKGAPGDLSWFLSDQSRGYYIPVNCGHKYEDFRWAFIQVPLAQAGTITRTEFAVYNWDGSICTNVEFHIGVYKASKGITQEGMPVPGRVQAVPLESEEPFPRGDWVQMPQGTPPLLFNKKNHAALWEGAFDRINHETGEPWGGSEATLNAQYHMPNPQYGFMQGWGTFERPCGYSPGAKDKGDDITGLLMDGANWSFDMMSNIEFPKAVAELETLAKEPVSSSYSVTVAIYAQNKGGKPYDAGDSSTNRWCYVMGRFFRQVQTGR